MADQSYIPIAEPDVISNERLYCQSLYQERQPDHRPVAPEPIFSPLHLVTNEERSTKEQRIFTLNQKSPANLANPVILHVNDYGVAKADEVASRSPFSDCQLRLVGHSEGKICFLNQAYKKYLIWDLETKQWEKDISFDSKKKKKGSNELSANGFGHTISGEMKIVRLTPPSLQPHYGFIVEICKEDGDMNMVWHEKKVVASNSEDCHYTPDSSHFGKLVSEGDDRFLYWWSAFGNVIEICRFDLHTETMKMIRTPSDDSLTIHNMRLGHGFHGRLTACISVPGRLDHQDDFSMLHVWTLKKEENEGENYWHKLLVVPLEGVAGLHRDLAGPHNDFFDFTPLSFFHGTERETVFLFHGHKEAAIIQLCLTDGKFFGFYFYPRFYYHDAEGGNKRECIRGSFEAALLSLEPSSSSVVPSSSSVVPSSHRVEKRKKIGLK